VGQITVSKLSVLIYALFICLLSGDPQCGQSLIGSCEGELVISHWSLVIGEQGSVIALIPRQRDRHHRREVRSPPLLDSAIAVMILKPHISTLSAIATPARYIKIVRAGVHFNLFAATFWAFHISY